MQLPDQQRRSCWGQSKHNPRSFPHFHDVNVHQGPGCNNCSFSAKKMHFGAKREVLRRGAMGVGCHAMQCCKGTSLRIAERGGCEFCRLALMGMDLSEVTLMWYDRPCPAATLQCKVELWCDTQGRLAAAAWHCRVKAKIWARPQHHHSLHARQCFPLGKSPFRF